MTDRRRRAPGWLIELPVVALGLAAFLGLTFYQIDLPGLHTDEALEVIPAVQLLRGQEIECFKGVCIDLLGLRLPVMIYEYIATVNTYMAIPFFAVLGINVPALRAMPIVQSAVAMVFLYLLARELYNRRVAMVALLMIAVSPSFVFWSRQGVFVTSVTIPISLASVWAWLRWWRSGDPRYFYLGSFTFGLGVSAKFLFGWLIVGVGGAFVLLNLDRIVACFRKRSLAPLFRSGSHPFSRAPGPRLRGRLHWHHLLIGGLLFGIGLLPQIIFNVETQSTINYIRDNVSTSSYYAIDNTNIAENLRERIKELRSVLNGETFWYLSIHPYASWRYPSAFVMAIGVVAFSLFGSKRQTLRETLPAWSTVAGTLVPSYVALFTVNLRKPYWYILCLGIATLASVLVGVFLARGRGWKAWSRQLWTGLSASLLFMLFVYLAWKLANWKVSQTAYWASVLGLLSAPWLRAREDARKALFPVLVIALMLVSSVFTPTALWFTHLAILTPWPILAIAAIADLVVRRLGLDKVNLAWLRGLSGRKWASAFSLGLLAVLALMGMLMYDDLEVDVAYHRELKIVGGKGDHTVASYSLVGYLQERQIRDVVAMDMGIQDVVQFLSQGEINPVEIFGYDDRQNVDGAFAIRVREQLENPDAVYVFHDTYPIFQNRWETFQQIVAGEGKEWVEEQIIYDWSAIPIFRLVRVTS
jgi:hypothetical protein